MTGGRPAREERDRRVKELFEKVLDAPAAEREALLARESASRSVQGDVEALLGTEAALGGFLETPAAHRLFGRPEDSPPPLAAGERVADFTVVSVLGEGGGGVVYEAEQREPRRRVALKLVRVGPRSGEALRRFRDEAANLARLHHTAIAHVYAAGVREHDGRSDPWIAMELIRGARSIVRFAADEHLGRDAKLRLFLVVCGALHHAHENGVVHRDVTPGNVLVDGDGVPKVVDFGVAYSAEDGPRGAGAVGTPGYASPEQLSGAAAETGRRTDVYGLGALLFELLTGTLPHDVGDATIADAARTKRTVAAQAPSRRTAGIPRDLDAIVLRALSPEPGARYESAAAFAADVARFLADEPVAAFGGGLLYQLAKFARRRRAVAAAIAVVFAALVGATAVSLRFAIDNARARDEAERRTYAAEVAAAAAALRLDDVAEAARRLDRAPPALRDWEWRHLASCLDASGATITFPRRELWCGDVSRDGRLLAIAGQDRSVGQGVPFAALARADGTIVREWPAPESPNTPSVAVSPDGAWFVAGFADGRLLRFDVRTGAETTTAAAHADRIIAVEFAADGSTFATAGADGGARLWSAADGAPRAVLTGHPDRVICLAFDPGGGHLVTGCRDGRIRVWDTATGGLLRTIAGHEASVEGVDVSPDGARIASVSRDQTVRLWNLADGTVVAVGRSHTSNVRGVAFDPAGAMFVSAGWDGTLRFWDAASGAERGLLRGHTGGVASVRFAADAPRLVSFSWDTTVKRWDPARADAGSARHLGDLAESLAFRGDGSFVASVLYDGSLVLLDGRSAAPVARLRLEDARFVDAEFADAEHVVALTDRGDLHVLDVSADGASVAVARRISSAGRPGIAMAVEPGGAEAWVIATGDDGLSGLSLRRIDLVSGMERFALTLAGEPHRIACDGRGGVAFAGRDGSVSVLSDGELRTAIVATGAIRSIAFDRAGRRIVVASEDGTARVLDAGDLATLVELRGHSGQVYEARFVPGARRLVTVSRDQTARIWDEDGGECLLVLHDHGYPVVSVAVSPDGSRIATGAGAGEDVRSTVRISEAPRGSR